MNDLMQTGGWFWEMVRKSACDTMLTVWDWLLLKHEKSKIAFLGLAKETSWARSELKSLSLDSVWKLPFSCIAEVFHVRISYIQY